MRLGFVFSIPLLGLSLPGAAQQLDYKKRYIGDIVPDVTMNNVRNYTTNAVKLSDFKKKYVILDFWSRGCTTCVAAFPDMQKLQEEFKDDIQILLVTYNSAAELEPLFQHSPIVKQTSLPMILSDTILGDVLFPHAGVPYQVWLAPDRKVKAMTWGASATVENIKDLISGKTLNVPIREDDLSTEPDKSLMVANNGRFLKNIVYYHSIVPGRGSPVTSPGLENGNILTDPSFPYYSVLMQNLFGLQIASSSQLSDPISGNTLCTAYFGSLPFLFQSAYQLPGGKIIMEPTVDSSFIIPDKSDAFKDINWSRQNYFYYEAVLPDFGAGKFAKMMQKDLNTFFGIQGKVEVRSMRCLVLTSIKAQNEALKTNGAVEIFEDTKSEKGYILQNVPFSYFRNILNSFASQADISFIDDSGIDQNKRIDITVHYKISELKALNRELAGYGLLLKSEVRPLRVLVVHKVSDGIK